MRLKYRYKKFTRKRGGSFLLPIIPIGLEHKGELINYEALIDSGADMNLFQWEIADYFGFNIKDAFGFNIKDAKDDDIIKGISGDPVKAYLFDVLIVVGGTERHIAPCWFTKDLDDSQFGF